MARWRCFLLLTLIFGALEVKAQECGENKNTSESNETKAVIEDTEDTFILTKDICSDGHRSSYLSSQCCKYFEGDDENIKFCYLKTPPTNNMDQFDQFITATKITECFYKRKKYMKSSHRLNFRQIKADAAKLEDPLQQKYMVDMYMYCACEARISLDEMEKEVRANPQARVWRMSLRKPYFFYVQYCVLVYSAGHQCPYFRYGSTEEDVNEKCLNYTQKCAELLK